MTWLLTDWPLTFVVYIECRVFKLYKIWVRLNARSWIIGNYFWRPILIEGTYPGTVVRGAYVELQQILGGHIAIIDAHKICSRFKISRSHGRQQAKARGWGQVPLWKCCKVFCALAVTVKRSVDQLFMHYFHNFSSASHFFAGRQRFRGSEWFWPLFLWRRLKTFCWGKMHPQRKSWLRLWIYEFAHPEKNPAGAHTRFISKCRRLKGEWRGKMRTYFAFCPPPCEN